MIRLLSQRVGAVEYLAAKHGQSGGGGGGWLPWLLLLAALISAVVLYYRMDFYRRRVHAEESLPHQDPDTLQRRLDHLPDKKDDYRILCYRLARGSQSGQRALASELGQLDLERHTAPEHPGAGEGD